MRLLTVIMLVFFFLPKILFGEVPDKTNDVKLEEISEDWTSMTSVDINSFERINLPHNSPEKIIKEVLGKEFIKKIGEKFNFNEAELKRIVLKHNKENECIDIERYGGEEEVFEKVFETIDNYVRSRQDGHTKEYAVTYLKEHQKIIDANDKDLRFLLKEYPYIPVGWLKKEDCRIFYNDPNDSERCVFYYLIDGEIAWTYELLIKPGESTWCMEEKLDAKEFDPKLKEIFEAVEKRIDKKMDEERLSKKLGACHTFWRLKKKYLKERGIEWKAPTELNPDHFYD